MDLDFFGCFPGVLVWGTGGSAVAATSAFLALGFGLAVADFEACLQ